MAGRQKIWKWTEARRSSKNCFHGTSSWARMNFIKLCSRFFTQDKAGVPVLYTLEVQDKNVLHSSYLSTLGLRQRSQRRTRARRRISGWVAAGHWWTLDRCCSWWTQSRRARGASRLWPASVEEAGCKRWRGLDCKRSLPLLIQRTVGGGGDCQGRRATKIRETGRTLEWGKHSRSQGTICPQSCWQGWLEPRFIFLTYHVTLQKRGVNNTRTEDPQIPKKDQCALR